MPNLKAHTKILPATQSTSDRRVEQLCGAKQAHGTALPTDRRVAGGSKGEPKGSRAFAQGMPIASAREGAKKDASTLIQHATLDEREKARKDGYTVVGTASLLQNDRLPQYGTRTLTGCSVARTLMCSTKDAAMVLVSRENCKDSEFAFARCHIAPILFTAEQCETRCATLAKEVMQCLVPLWKRDLFCRRQRWQLRI